MIGIDAAASGGSYFRGSGQGYAIPINRALKIAGQIEAGRSSSTVHVGPTAFLGVGLGGPDESDVPGALIERVAPGSPADRAGIGASDVIVAFAGKRVASPTALRKLVLQSSRADRARHVDRSVPGKDDRHRPPRRRASPVTGYDSPPWQAPLSKSSSAFGSSPISIGARWSRSRSCSRSGASPPARRSSGRDRAAQPSM